MKDTDLIFLDTNIWLYSFLQSEKTSEKKDIADQLILQEQVVLSTQVINEVCVNLIKKTSFEEAEIQELIKDFYRRCIVIQISYKILVQSSQLRQNYCFSYWDSLIVACTLDAEVQYLYSEDMQNRLIIFDHLKIINPFS